ncbi:hypothetical protein AM232_03555 [Bacillus sp. FJAT-21352]|nr:hypothetical protein AM232_03555 [Bacillus sp. FJAT-21352]
MIEADVRDSCGKSASRGDPAGESRGGRRLPDRPRKASAWSGDKRQIVQAKKIDKLDFHRVCLQSERIGLRPILFFVDKRGSKKVKQS